MARIEFSGIAFRAAPNTDIYTRDREPFLVERAVTSESNRLGQFTMLDVAIRRVTTYTFYRNGETYEIAAFVMTTEERDKFPPLPPGFTFSAPNDIRFPDDAGCVRLHFDPHYLDSFIDRELGNNHSDATDASASRITAKYYTRYSYSLRALIKPTFDPNNEADRATKFTDHDGETDIFMTTGATTCREVYEQTALVEGGIIGVWDYWHAQRERHYVDKYDANMAARAMTQARKAFGATKSTDLAKAHVPKGRRITLELDPRVPFPADCKFDQWNQTLLAFRITGNGFRKPMQDVGSAFYVEDCVFIHREGGMTRFIFWEGRTHRVKEDDPTRLVDVVYVMPIHVPDSYCTLTAPLSPQRGMDPQVTRAVAQNPYFASAFQHVMHRRNYLRTRLPASGDMLDPDPSVPVLVRSRDGNLKGDKWTAKGRKNARERANMVDKTTKVLLMACGPNEILFDEPTVQRVADVEEKVMRRALVLDM